MVAGVRGASLRLRLLLVVAVAVVPALGLIVLDAREERDEDRARAEAEVWRELDLVSAAHRTQVDSGRQLLIAIHRIEAVARQTDDCAAILSGVRSAHAEYADLGVATRDGRVACHAIPGPAPASVADTTWFRRAVASRSFATGDYANRNGTSGPVFALAQPILADGQVTAVVFASLDLAFLRRLAERTELPADTAMIMVRGDGLVLARHPDPRLYWTGRTLPETPLFRAMHRVGTGTAVVAGIDDVRRIWAFRDVGHAWLSVGRDVDSVYGPSERDLRRDLLLMGLVAFAAFALAWLGTRATLRPLEALTATAQRLARGDLGARALASKSPAEIARLAVAFDDMAAAVAQREISLRETAQALERRTAELHRLLARFDAAREEEAARIARDIHDVVGQALTALKMDVVWVTRHLDEPGRLEGRLQTALGLLDSTLDAVRGIATALRPSMLDDLGLAAAIEWQANELAARAGLRCALHLDHDVVAPQRSATAMFRVFQELATNITRHAQASEMTVRLAAEDGWLALDVGDDGIGIPAEAIHATRSLGLLGIRERVTQCGGTVAFAPRSPRGTLVTVRIPGGVR